MSNEAIMCPSTPVKASPSLGIEHDTPAKGVIDKVQSPAVVKAAEAIISLKNSTDQSGHSFSFQVTAEQLQNMKAEANQYMIEQLGKPSPFQKPLVPFLA